MFIGNRLREIRKIKELTLKQLSELSGLSIGYLSNLERNETSPTLEQLQKICISLQVNMVDILESAQTERIIIKKSERNKIFNNEAKVYYENLVEGHRKLGAVCITIKENTGYDDSDMWQHNFDEIGVIVKGMMMITVDGKEYLLGEGDTIYIAAYVPHKYYNPLDVECVSYWTFQDSSNIYLNHTGN